MMSLDSFSEAIQAYPIIASLRSEELLPAAISSKAKVILISSGNIFNICDISQELRRHNKQVLVHVDLINGLGKDPIAVQFLKRKAQVVGIVTPNGHLIASAHKEGLLTVHRLFAHDSPSLISGFNVLRQSKPHYIEILPGLAVTRVVSHLRDHFQQPVIAAGLIKSIQDVKLVFKAGAVAVDTSAEKLWNIENP
ncbi:MAG TPA: glycerol-3-phosphate responsive antiterminator [Syntrophomonadaceae bacterium]|nr:glycerol-3-phosphate responsive antiterminator [Syntrophomonadaceae bacterium]